MKHHRLDPFSLVFGATFASLGAIFLFARVNLARLHLRWAWPAPIIVIGALIIALAYRGDRGEGDTSEP